MKDEELLRDLNGYLAMELGIDAPIGTASPFRLAYLGVIDAVRPTVLVFDFEHDCRRYFTVAGDSLEFYPTAGMSFQDLSNQCIGAAWLDARRPIDLDTSVLGDPAVPTALHRRDAVERLVLSVLGASARVSLGLFLAATGDYICLAELDGTGYVVTSAVASAIPIAFPKAPGWRRIAVAIGSQVPPLP